MIEEYIELAQMIADQAEAGNPLAISALALMGCTSCFAIAFVILSAFGIV